MILVTLGSQKFQFNRLLKEIDRLVERGNITEEVFAQIGYSDYKPQNYKYRDFLGRDEFGNFMEKCDKVITHGGTGAIMGAVKKNKRVIAVPRLKEYGEHVDNHQEEIVSQFSKMNLICKVNNIDDLEICLRNINDKSFNTYFSKTNDIIYEITKFIEN